MECQIETTRARCACTYEPCVRKGKCCDCIAYHLKYDELPGCVFPAEVEKGYDRSFACFVSVFHGRGWRKNLEWVNMGLMNKTRRVATLKHRRKNKKLVEKRKLQQSAQK